MKHLNSFFATMLFAFLLLAGNANLQAQTTDAQFTAIAGAIQAGDAEGLAKYFHSTLEVILPPDVDKSFSSQQATFVLKEFFGKQGVKSFKILHKGTSGATNFMTGMCVTSKGQFDSNIFLKKIGSQYLITQIRFESTRN